MSAKHTPGPWAAFTDGSGTKPHTNIVAYVPCTAVVFSLPGHDKTDADVRLIAAAPDLLEALQNVLEACEGYAPNTSKQVWAEAFLAITKATGSAS